MGGRAVGPVTPLPGLCALLIRYDFEIARQAIVGDFEHTNDTRMRALWMGDDCAAISLTLLFQYNGKERERMSDELAWIAVNPFGHSLHRPVERKTHPHRVPYVGFFDHDGLAAVWGCVPSVSCVHWFLLWIANPWVVRHPS
jgi:hypothetical protein